MRDDGAVKCLGCGTENREGAAFCDECGTSLQAACPSCGAANRPGAKFCDACGTAIAPTLETPAHLARKILEERGRIEGERRTVTVLFADAKGFTPLSERLGEEKVYEFVQRCVELMVAGVHGNEGTVTQFTGDGIVALFGAPIAHEDSPRRAVAAALEIQRALTKYIDDAEIDTAFRIGLNTGPVVVGRISDDLSMDYTAVGDTVNLAARMEQMCEPRAVFLTENTHRLVAEYFDFEDMGHIDVKGKSEPVHIFKALNPRGVRTRLDAAIARGLSPFTGRDPELRMLNGFWEDAVSSRGGIVLISGEPGIGKSRLLLEFKRSLPDDVIWREAQCVPYGEGIPYLPVVDLVRSGFGIAETDDEGTIIEKVDADTADWTPQGQKTVPYLKFLLQVDPGDALIETMDGADRRAGILDSLRALILERSRVAPRVVVVEDLHWADDASEEAFRVCADAVAASKVLMILTFRPGYLHPSADLPHAHRIVLNDLDADARRTLASSTLRAASLSSDLADPVTDKAEGNPLFIEEVAKALAAGATNTGAVPDSLQDVILARIDRLEGNARGALQLASVIGREFTLRLLTRISDVHSELDSVLSELKALELIYEKAFFPELAYMFKHALTHDVAYSTLLVERRKAMHRIVATAIEELYDDRIIEHYETLAHHYSKSEDWEKAADYLEKAGDKASATFANTQAIDYYRRALDAFDCLGIGSERAAGIWEKVGFTNFTIGKIPDAAEAFERMLEAVREAGDVPLESAALARRGLVELIGHDFDRSEPTLRDAIALAPEPNERYLPTLMLAMQLLITDRHEEAAPYLAEATELAATVDDPVAVGFWNEMAVIIPNWNGEYEEAIRRARESRMGSDTESIDQFTAMANLGGTWAEALALCGAGRYEEALEKLHYVLARCERIGDVFYRLRSLNTIGWVYLELGDLDRGWEWNARALEVAVELGLLDPEIDSNAHLNLGDVLVARGDLEGAEEQFKKVEKIYRNPAPEERWMLWRYGQHMLHSYGELLLARGDVERATAFARECIEMAERSSALKNAIKGRRLLGQALAADGKLDLAEAELRTALDVARRVANPTQLWKTLGALGDVLNAMDRPDHARDAYEEAASVIDGVAASLQDESLRETFLGSRYASEVRAKAG